MCAYVAADEGRQTGELLENPLAFVPPKGSHAPGGDTAPNKAVYQYAQ